MASLRNAIRREIHKERAQPNRRRHLGLLEKHKDYVKRAQDYHAKERVIKNLQKKAENRNPDEFYFSMMQSKTKDGVHEQRRAGRVVDMETAKQLKTEDMGYIVARKLREQKAADKLLESLHFVSDERLNKRTVFVDDDREAEAIDEEALLQQAAAEARARATQGAGGGEAAAAADAGAAPRLSSEDARRLQRKRQRAYEELGQSIKMARKLEKERSKLEVQRNVMGPGTKVRIKKAKGGKPAVYKWKHERKR